MCIDSDLFGDVIVLKSDVQLWIDSSPMMQGRSKSQVEYYVKTFDVINKIKLMKLNDSFKNIEAEFLKNKLYDVDALQFLGSRYVEILDEKKPACPDWFHICNNFECVVFKQQLKREKNRARWLNRKAT